jgi:hypothetical protein
MFQRITTPGRCALVVVPAFAIVLAAPGTAPAKDKRHANVVVENKTGNVIEVVTVAHKYSDNYKQAKTWGNLPNGQPVKEPLVVEYNTGFGTTGRDWWVVSWKYQGDDAIYLTDPFNLRGPIDALEKATIKALPGAGTAAGGAIGGEPGAAIGGPAADQIGKLFLNTESTDGFKQHILRDEDSQEKGGGKPTVIEIGTENVKFRSPSGESTTRISAAKKK